MSSSYAAVSQASDMKIAREARLTEYTIPRLAKAADISDWLSVFDSSLSKYLNVLSNCSSCAGVKFVMFLDTIWGYLMSIFTNQDLKDMKHAWLSINEIFFIMLCLTRSSSNDRSCEVKTV